MRSIADFAPIRNDKGAVRYDLFSGWSARHEQLADRVRCYCSLPALPLKYPVRLRGPRSGVRHIKMSTVITLG
jgi:hypothetical protein